MIELYSEELIYPKTTSSIAEIDTYQLTADNSATTSSSICKYYLEK